MKLLLIRHGQSEGNAAHRIQGQGEFPLTELGREQARRLARRLSATDGDVAAIYASSQSRAVETAEILAEALGAPVILDDRLREFDVGALTGLTMAEVAVRFPDFHARWTVDSDEWVPLPGGEGNASFRHRVCQAIAEIVARHSDDETVAVVGHGGTLGAYLAEIMGIPLERKHPFAFDNASLTVLNLTRRRSRLLLHNDTCHLTDHGGER